MRPSPKNGDRCRADLDLDKLPPQAGEVDCASARFSEIGYAIVSTQAWRTLCTPA
ncbi:hypothetical protein GOD35_23055 [Sinorhizobium medicae]|nr:hypothetical protein [Sinorhizobium medicae]MDX0548232.1 hypothetical protein [Sinorhizobium medicae]MDX0635106.1 hypothetical protein [Sinorhizobium medicae]MDX0667322.1 hypothetical protein [Sinorhizobium medicae]MDX0715372.1 hypothetical protein [Sinorhizobium medicae]